MSGRPTSPSSPRAVSPRAVSPRGATSPRGPASPSHGHGFPSNSSATSGGTEMKKRGKYVPEPNQNKKTINTLLDAIKNQPKFAKMAQYSAGCLAKLVVDEVTAEEMINSGSPEVLMTCLHQNPDAEGVMEEVNNVIHGCTKTNRTFAMLSPKLHGQMGPFVNSLKSHKNPFTLLSTCQSLSTLAKDPVLLKEMAEAGAIPYLANIIKSFPLNPKLLASAASVLAQLAALPQYASQIVESGAIQVLIEALKKFKDDPNLAHATALLIANLSAAGPDIVNKLKEMGAVSALTQIAEQFPLNKQIIASVAEALKHLTGDSEMSDTLSRITKGAINAEIAKALSMLGSLCLVQRNVEFLSKNGGIEPVIAVMKGALEAKDNAASHGILLGGCRAIARVGAMNHEGMIYEMIKHGAPKVLHSILQSHMKDEAMVLAALQAVMGLLSRAENAKYCAQIGLIKDTIEAIREHASSPTIAAQAMAVLEAFARFPDAADYLIANGGAEAVITLLKNHISDKNIVLQGMAVLGLMGQSPENLKALINAGIIPALLQILRQYEDDPDVLLKALALMDMLATIPEGIEAFKRLGAMKAVAAVLSKYPDNSALQAIGTAFLNKLAGIAEKGETAVKEVAVVLAVAEKVTAKQVQDEEAKHLKRQHDNEKQIEENLSIWAREYAKWKAEEPLRQAEYAAMKRKEEAERIAREELEMKQKQSQEALRLKMAELEIYRANVREARVAADSEKVLGEVLSNNDTRAHTLARMKSKLQESTDNFKQAHKLVSQHQALDAEDDDPPPPPPDDFDY